MPPDYTSATHRNLLLRPRCAHRELSDVHFQRSAAPPLRRQLAARLAGLIRDGYLAPGTRLPSVRRLAEDLGLHRNTVWASYQCLERAKLVVARQGSGVFVTDSQATVPVPVHPAPRLVLAEPFAQVRAVVECELQTRLGLPVGTVHPRFFEGASSPRNWEDETLLLARRAVLTRLRSRRLAPTRVYQLEPAGGSRELAIVSRLRPHSVVAVVTEVASVRHFARMLALTARREGIGFASPRPGDQTAVRRATRIADIVFTDAFSKGLIDRRYCRRLVELRVLADRSIRALRTATKCRAA